MLYLIMSIIIIFLAYPRVINSVTGHRGLTHKFIYSLVMITLVYYFFDFNEAFAFGIGYFSHLLFDKIS